MTRCIELAKKGIGNVAPNPMVGAVLVHDDVIIGEGFHEKYGEAHAEVNCIHAALKVSPDLIASSTLFVSLEPCAHFGKTPPCADFIIRHKIPKVVIGCRDDFAEVNGKGIEILKQAGIEVIEGVLENQALKLNTRFFTFHHEKRPYIVLKWAQTSDGFIASGEKRIFITNGITNRIVHKWRSEASGILIGANTAIADDPLLDNRNWYGKSPVKIVIDPHLKCTNDLQLFHQGEKVIVANVEKEMETERVSYFKINDQHSLPSLLKKFHECNIQSLLIEGGRYTLQSFIDTGLWDEARIITNTKLSIGSGLNAPKLLNAEKISEENIVNDRIEFFENKYAAT